MASSIGVNTDSGKVLLPVRLQTITWNNANLLLIEPLGTNFSDIWIKIHKLPFTEMFLKLSSPKCHSSIYSLAPETCGSEKSVISKHMLRTKFMITSCEHAPRWILQNTSDDKSTLVQVMAWCRQATSHYLSQCWPRSMLPYGITRPPWVNHFPIFNTPSLWE